MRETGIPSAVRARFLTASLEDDTEFSAIKEFSDSSFRTFVDVPFRFFEAFIATGVIRSIDLGLSSGVSTFAYSLERR